MGEFKITPGMARANKKEPKHACTSCGLNVPKYPGRYPAKCPNCSAEFQVAEWITTLRKMESVRAEEYWSGCSSCGAEIGPYTYYDNPADPGVGYARGWVEVEDGPRSCHQCGTLVDFNVLADEIEEGLDEANRGPDY